MQISSVIHTIREVIIGGVYYAITVLCIQIQQQYWHALHCLPSSVSPGFRGFSPTSPNKMRQVAIFKIRGKQVMVMGFRKGEWILNLTVLQG
jgi:hypothetical protein